MPKRNGFKDERVVVGYRRGYPVYDRKWSYDWGQAVVGKTDGLLNTETLERPEPEKWSRDNKVIEKPRPIIRDGVVVIPCAVCESETPYRLTTDASVIVGWSRRYHHNQRDVVVRPTSNPRDARVVTVEDAKLRSYPVKVSGRICQGCMEQHSKPLSWETKKGEVVKLPATSLRHSPKPSVVRDYKERRYRDRELENRIATLDSQATSLYRQADRLEDEADTARDKGMASACVEFLTLAAKVRRQADRLSDEKLTLERNRP